MKAKDGDVGFDGGEGGAGQLMELAQGLMGQLREAPPGLKERPGPVVMPLGRGIHAVEVKFHGSKPPQGAFIMSLPVEAVYLMKKMMKRKVVEAAPPLGLGFWRRQFLGEWIQNFVIGTIGSIQIDPIAHIPVIVLMTLDKFAAKAAAT